MREIYGKFFYEDVEYPFAYKDYIIYLITGGKVYIDVFKDSDNHKFIEGMDNNGNRLIFLDCEFSKNIFSITNIIKTTGVIVLRGNNKIDCNNIYDRISFRSKALNVFSPPMSISKTDIKNFDGKLVVETPSFKQSNINIEFDNYKVIFGYYNSENFNQPTLLSSIPVFYIEHNISQSVDDIKTDYLRILNLLSFVSFSRSVEFDDIEISKKIDGKFHNVGKVYIHQRECDYTFKENKMITLREIPKESFKNLFETITSDNDYWKHYYIPKKPTDVNIIDHSKWITTAACFEGVFNNFFPNFKAQENQDFAYAKEEILKASNDCLSTLKGKRIKKYAKKCIEQVKNYDGLLEEKFRYALEYIKPVSEKTINEAMIRIGTSLELDLAEEYATVRNKLAHGAFEELDLDACGVYYAMNVMIYSIILKQSSIPDETAKAFIKKLFG